MRLKPLLHLAVILGAVTGAYLWLSTPELKLFSLQAFTAAFLLYIFVRKTSARSLWEVAPRALSLEISILTFAFLLIIGSTGNLQSLFYPLTYVHLFLIVFTTSSGAAIATTFAIVLFHYALSSNIGLIQFIQLTTIPLFGILFLFARQLYQSNQEKKTLLENQLEAESQESEDDPLSETEL